MDKFNIEEIDTIASSITTKVKETEDNFIFQTINDWSRETMNYTIEKLFWIF